MAALSCTTARGMAPACTVQRPMAPRFRRTAARTPSHGRGWLQAAAAPPGSRARSAVAAASSGSGGGSEAARQVGPAPPEQAAWLAPVNFIFGAAVRRLLFPCLLLAAGTWQRSIAALALLVMPWLMASSYKQLAIEAQFDVERMCSKKPLAEVLEELRSEYAVVKRRCRINMAALAFAAGTLALLAAVAEALSPSSVANMLSDAARLLGDVREGYHSVHSYGSLGAGVFAGIILMQFVSPAAKHAIELWRVHTLKSAAERRYASEVQAGTELEGTTP
ncbi:hypothetical protein C2E21_2530 [Chlorella sorokiniana]|uniref:Uncharacterized protein n=1 Tax=Chlorella sorokiniana TaxID=3076 RepID=A0A2P6TYV1_CHLSO|nr:hypothetical protein C2E21_2530 [Chlorella sorokiniana]|eukprot:PRW59241.1 hypothetical protein C2E21_2530 [Chlorella sorokiniana]